MFAGFVAWEARTPHPMVPLQLFRSRTFSGVNLLTVFLYGALAGGLFFVPFVLIQGQGYSAAQAGAAFLPFSLPLGLLSGRVGGLMGRSGRARPLIAGTLIVAARLRADGQLRRRRAATGAAGCWAFLLFGAGMTLVVAPLTTAVFNSVDDAWSGVASGVNNAVTRTAQLLAVAALRRGGGAGLRAGAARALARPRLPPAAEPACWRRPARWPRPRPPDGLGAGARPPGGGARPSATVSAPPAGCAVLALRRPAR